jgi:hypothetical protein
VLGNPGDVVPLAEALHDSVWFVRATAVQALGRLGEQAAVAPLKMALHDEDEAVRAAAVRALGTMGEHVPLEVFLAALHDSAWQVREMAVLTLGSWREPVPRAAITSALQDEDELVRQAAHLLLETSPDRFAEAVQSGEQVNDALSLEDEQDHQQAVYPQGQQRYPRRGRLRVLRLALLACWTIFLGYLVGVAWILIQLTHADPAQMSHRLVIQVLSTPFSVLTNLPFPLRGVCIALVALLFFGCLWATRDAWYEHRCLSRGAVGHEEDEVETGDRDQLRRVPVEPSTYYHSPRLLSRRAVLVGLTAALLVGNTIAWSLLLNSRRRPQGNAALAPGSTLFIYRGHQNEVVSVAWSPDGKRIASVSDDTIVQVWDAITGNHAYTYRGHHSLAVNDVEWSPDSRRIALGNQDTTVEVWDATDGSHIYTYRGHTDQVNTVAWSPDGTRIASGSSDTTVQVWEAG